MKRMNYSIRVIDSVEGGTRRKVLLPFIQNFVAPRMQSPIQGKKQSKEVSVITLSDSEDETIPSFHQKPFSSINDEVCPKNEQMPSATSGTAVEDDSIIIIEESAQKSENPEVLPLSLDDSVVVLGSPSHKENLPKAGRVKQWFCQDVTVGKKGRTGFVQNSNKMDRVRPRRTRKSETEVSTAQFTMPSDSDDIEICEVTSTTEEPSSSTAQRIVSSKNQMIVVQPRKKNPAPDFIPLTKKRKFKCEKNSFSKKKKLNTSGTSSKNQCSPVPLLQRVPAVPRRLRPVVIDGSNVAVSHGNRQTYSCKGIHICIDHFLRRGHTQVTCFVPEFRKFAVNRKNLPTTDPGILGDLAKRQLVVFTPSRVLHGRRINSYDDRFMIQLAVMNGGVIVSNDHYNDLIDEHVDFKKVIEKRLIPFCFSGDFFLPAHDPLGSEGPSLDEVLTFDIDEHPPSSA